MNLVTDQDGSNNIWFVSAEWFLSSWFDFMRKIMAKTCGIFPL